MRESIHPDITMGPVSLSVADLARSIAFYEDSIGLHVLDQQAGRAVMGAGETVLLNLHEQPGAKPMRGVAGLYHFAILLPNRTALARSVRNLAETRTPVTGVADHLVSEALYLDDPDGHGIEIYCDRPRAGWLDQNGGMDMGTLPLDLGSVMEELVHDPSEWQGIHPGAVMGHVHLHVSDLKAAERFFVDLLGFDPVPLNMHIASASFISAGGYHHHLGLNVWAGVGAPPPPPEAARMLHFEIHFPHEAALQSALERLGQGGVELKETAEGVWVQDPSAHQILLRTVG